MNIINKNLKKNIRTVGLRSKLTRINNIKYLPAFTKEWKNIIYSFNKNNMKNIGANSININKVIKGYFNMYFKDHKFIGRTRFLYLKRRRKEIKRIYVSDANIKYTNNKAKITLFTVNKMKKTLKRKNYKLNIALRYKLFKFYSLLYKKYIENINKFLTQYFEYSKPYIFARDLINKRTHLRNIFRFLSRFLEINRLILKKMWILIIKTQSKKHFQYLRKYNLLYSLNQFKFNKSNLLSKLTYSLQQIIGKKIEYNIVNLKSITLHPDIFTEILALNIQKDKNRSPRRRMKSLLAKAGVINTRNERFIMEKLERIDIFRDKYRDLNITSLFNNNNKDISGLVNNIINDDICKRKNTPAFNFLEEYKKKPILDYNILKKIHLKRIESNSLINYKKLNYVIFNSIKHKYLSGIKLKVSGRLTKRYRADRAVKALKWKGGLKNFDSSFKNLSSVSFRGNANSNVSYSLSTSKRRIGSFAVKGWIGAK
jgi:hypothetical protein